MRLRREARIWFPAVFAIGVPLLILWPHLDAPIRSSLLFCLALCMLAILISIRSARRAQRILTQHEHALKSLLDDLAARHADAHDLREQGPFPFPRSENTATTTTPAQSP